MQEPRVVKRAVSLPRDLDTQIEQFSRASHQAYSTIVRLALGSFVEKLEELEVERAYRAYYNDATKAADTKLAGELFAVSKRSWPD